MTSDFGKAIHAQKNGDAPTILAYGSAPGESGLSVVHVHYQGSAHFMASLKQHMISFVSPARMHCRLEGGLLTHEAHEGSLAIGPAGLDTSADSDRDLTSLIVMVQPDKLALAAAEDGTLEAQLTGRLRGDDQALLNLARRLVLETKEGYPRGTIFWNETAGRFIDALATNHMVGSKTQPNDLLNPDMVKRLKDFVCEHLGEPLNVATLAKMTNRSQFHFSRVFARSVGVSPYRYVAHLRLQRAVEMIREGRLSLADVAAKTGFADQSHLSRWVRRVHGVSPTQLLPRQAAAE
jgi:AraC family transcriptional regulator